MNEITGKASLGTGAAGGGGPSRRVVLGGLLTVGVAVPLGGCELLYPTYCWNQKLVLLVETPEGERRGESVSHVCYGYHIHMNGQGYAGTLKRAEAVVVDLGGGRHLFATIDRWQDLVPIHCKRQLQALGAKVVHPYAFKNPKATWHKLVRKLKGQRCPIAPEDLPLLVTFEDIDDPKTVKRVDPRNLAATFGPGYRLKAAWVEVTDEPVTMGKVERVLGWLAKTWPNQLDGNRYETVDAKNRLANSLSANSFSTEIRGVR